MTQVRINEFDAELTSRLQGILDERVAQQHCPSVVAIIFQGDRILMESGVGERKLGGAAQDTQTAYRIASCSKSFTIVTLMMLRQRGLVNLDAPIADYVAKFTQGDMGRAVERVSGRPFWELVADEVLRPLNRHETGYERSVVAPDQLAYGYRPGLEGLVELPFAGPGAFSSIGGLFSSARYAHLGALAVFHPRRRTRRDGTLVSHLAA